jgi:large subunit ribosomal protein L29
MTKKKISQVREKENAQLTQELAERVRHLFDLRSQAVTEKLEDPSQLRKTRKEIARIKTVLRERELTAQREAQQQAK